MPRLDSLAMSWAKVGWPIGATMSKFRPSSHSTFFFFLNPRDNEGGPGCYIEASSIGMGCPVNEDYAVRRLAWVGRGEL